MQRLFEHVDATPGEYSGKDIPPYFRHNGAFPASGEYKRLYDGAFTDWRLKISGLYYDAHPIGQMRNHLTMLAYDMNGEPLPYGHGAPLREIFGHRQSI